jgi:integrase
MAGERVMLSKMLTHHVELHRGLGFKFRTQHGLLRSFVSFAEAHGDTFVHVDRVLEWARQAPSSPQRRNRLVTVRRFALALHAEDAQHQVPPGDALGREMFRRRVPYIYTPDEISRLMAATSVLPTGSDRPLTYATLFGLLAVTGMRISEALALRLDDITTDGLVIRRTKFQKSRLLPLHDTARSALDHYVLVRRRMATSAETLFVSAKGHVLSDNTVRYVFLRLARSVDLRGKPDQRAPRIHDLRHTYAVRSLEQCGSEPDKVARHLLALSTYLGHAHVTDTYWYLQATQILMTRIAEVSESAHQGGVA